MKHYFKIRFRSIFASALAASIFMLSLTACQGMGEHPLSGARKAFSNAFSETVSSGPVSAPARTAASSAAVSAFPAVSSPVSSGLSAAAPKQTVRKTKNDVRTVKKIAVCAAAAPIGTLNAAAADAPAGYRKIDQRGGYGALTVQGEKDLYGLIGKSVYQISTAKNAMGYYSLQTVEIPSGLSEAQICKTVVAYQDDNPQVFWVANAYSIGTKGNTAYLQLYSNLSLQQCNEYNQKFTAAVTAAEKSVPAGLNEFGREEAIFNSITGRCSYDQSAVTDPALWQSYTAYGALVNGKAVCEGYSRAMQLLSAYAGLQCTLMRGTAEGGNHMWNCVSIDGHWYQLDVTWCDNTSLIYNYFNIPDQVLSATHTPAPAVSSMSDSQISNAAGFYNLSVPVCDSTLANYFLVRGIRVGDPGGLDDAAIVNAMTQQLKAGRGTIAFSIGPNSNFDAAVKQLILRMSGYLRSASQAAGKTLNLDSVRYLADSPDCGVNIIVSYA